MHSCPECQQACYCDMEDHESELLDGEECEHECDGIGDLDEIESDYPELLPAAVELEALGQMRLEESNG